MTGERPRTFSQRLADDDRELARATDRQALLAPTRAASRELRRQAAEQRLRALLTEYRLGRELSPD